MSDLSIAVIGDGKMGRAVADIAREQGVRVTTVVGPDRSITRETLAGATVAIEFTEPSAAVKNVLACVDAECPVVVGTTGWYDRLGEVSELVTQRRGTMLWAANFSLGVHLFTEIARYAATLLARVPAFDAHLIETHHTAKKDAPSGTAVMLHKAVAPALGHDVPTTSIRVGSVPGTHELVFDARYEQILLTHTARDRRVFAEGAMTAARWLHGRTSGIYTLADVLGTTSS